MSPVSRTVTKGNNLAISIQQPPLRGIYALAKHAICFEVHHQKLNASSSRHYLVPVKPLKAEGSSLPGLQADHRVNARAGTASFAGGHHG
eukprot:scaffold208966_cov21-Tisochrysis_lutea.AAC.1